ncbi:MAG TPA: hypothetical protein VK775_12495 [Chthoniobacterales bacterium]|nr:hypothetical protein [Chthoniobacterales bacterium]
MLDLNIPGDELLQFASASGYDTNNFRRQDRKLAHRVDGKTSFLSLHGAWSHLEPTSEYVYEKLNAYNLSHAFLMRQFADLAGTPIAELAGDAVVHHFRKIYHGQLILNVGISTEHATELIAAGLGDFVAFGREYIANPDLVERIRLHSPLNEQRPEGYYGATAFGYTDYPILTTKVLDTETKGVSLSLSSGLK